MPKLTAAVPKYRKHKATGQAVVTLNGHDFYLGPHNTAASRLEYDQQIAEWLRLRLLHPHEAERLRGAYRALDARDDDWIVESRALSYTQIALYLGAFLLVCGSLFYFVAARWYEHVARRGQGKNRNGRGVGSGEW